MRTTAVLVFAAVYAGMILGRFPRLQLDRTGIALLGAIVLLASETLPLERAGAALDVPTLALLFGLMVVSAQLRLGGFYAWSAGHLARARLGPRALLLALTLCAGALAAVFSNDIVCLAMAPVLIESARRRGLDCVPFLLALACASNVGSAATLIGNPQNMLIGESLDLSFAGYLVRAGPLALAGLVATWAVIAWQERGRWDVPGGEVSPEEFAGEIPPFDRWQTSKGLGVAAALLIAFLATGWPRELVALAGAGVLLTSRKLHSRSMLGLVDWQLLVLFIGLFLVNYAFQATGLPEAAVAELRARGLDPAAPGWLFAATVVLSNAVSNVPAVMLLLPLARHELAGPVLALASTLAGNLFVVGSIANLIVLDAAERHGVAIGWRRHARTGLPVTAATLALAAGWLWLQASW